MAPPTTGCPRPWANSNHLVNLSPFQVRGGEREEEGGVMGKERTGGKGRGGGS